LIHHRAILAEVIFFHAIQFGVVKEKGIAGAQYRSRLGLRKLDPHFLVAPDENLSRFRGCVLHYGCVFYVFNIRRQGAEILRGLIHHLEHGVGRPLRRSLRGTRHHRESFRAKRKNQWNKMPFGQ
jgi:hypothetical protein